MVTKLGAGGVAARQRVADKFGLKTMITAWERY